MKEKNIIDKLGITVGPWKHTKEGEEWGIDSKDDTICRCPVYPGSNNWPKNYPLIKSAPEMLETLIDAVLWQEKIGYTKEQVYDICGDFIKIIEKACWPKSWEEIKRIIK